MTVVTGIEANSKLATGDQLSKNGHPADQLKEMNFLSDEPQTSQIAVRNLYAENEPFFYNLVRLLQ